MNIVICCSMSQIDEARAIRESIIDRSDGIVTVPESAKNFEMMSDHRDNFLTLLDRADLVLVLQKPDGTIGESTSYEMAYCKHMQIPYLIVGDERPYIKEAPTVEEVYKTAVNKE